MREAEVMTSDLGDLVLDLMCGSRMTAYVAEQWGRRWNAAKAMDRHGNKLLVVVRLKETRA